MKSYIFPVLITTLGLFTAYAFYAVWHSEEVNPPKIIKDPKTKIEEELAYTPKVVVPKASLDTQTQGQAQDEKEILEDMQKQKNTLNVTPEQMEAQTQEVYDSLTPEDHDETMEEATIAFDALDAHVEAMDAKLAEEMKDIETVHEEQLDNNETIEEQVQDDMTISIAESEEEIDITQEDINNL